MMIPSQAVVLVVDDDAAACWALSEGLYAAGFRVHTVASGESALRAVRHAAPDLLITDVRMPGMSGIALLSQVRSGWPDLPVVVTTAYSSVGTAAEALRLGAADYLPKPLDLAKVVAVVERVLGQPKGSRGAVQPAIDHLLPSLLTPPDPLITALGTAADDLFDQAPGEAWQRYQDRIEAVLLRQALHRTGGNRLQAARLLGIHRATLRRRLAELGIASGGDDEPAT